MTDAKVLRSEARPSIGDMESQAGIAVDDMVRAAEQDLRVLIEVKLSETLGVDWFEGCGLSEVRRETVVARRDEEMRGRRGNAATEGVIAFTDLTDLGKIIKKHWVVFKPVLVDQAEFLVMFDALCRIRNPHAHHRDLLPFERALVEGICGQIRNQVTIWRSAMDRSGAHYPRIEMIQDSLGNKYDGRGAPFHSVYTDMALTVGQRVEFLARGWDPHGRKLTWILQDGAFGGVRVDSAEGGEVRLAITIEERHVGESLHVATILKADSPYHRLAEPVGFDDQIGFVYDVLPPETGHE